MDSDGDEDMSLFDEAHLDAAEQRAEHWISKLRHNAPRSSPNASAANAANATGPASDQETQASLDQGKSSAEGGNLQTQNTIEDPQGLPLTQLPVRTKPLHPAEAWDKISDGARRVLVKVLLERHHSAVTTEEQERFVGTLLIGALDLRADQLRGFIHCLEDDRCMWKEYTDSLSRIYASWPNTESTEHPIIPQLSTVLITKADVDASLVLLETIAVRLGPLDILEKELRDWQGWSST
ncbi:hypothetical protein N3K66_008308 [Trichothecium roseum]|uniref:Uncharacterized protein n=1 Tax=Trichothecium roseum TaxID=47278 RepID=A0ACC0UUF1_9HYPO|nr:hypothetical protein N3K66_008308 [Trichothecium roseum]